jgi:hypothetical protein
VPPCNDQSQQLEDTRVVVDVLNLAEVRCSPSILCKSSLRFRSEALEVLLEYYALEKSLLIVEKWVDWPEKADMMIGRLAYCTIAGQLLLLLFLAVFAPVASTKNAGLAGKFDNILTQSFLFSA